MTPDDWIHVKRIVTDALALSVEDQPAFLLDRCPDERIRFEAESLLASIAASADWFEEPVLTIDGVPAALDVFELMPSAPDQLLLRPPALDQAATGDFRGTSRYIVRRRIGAGGMGFVY